MRKYLLIIICSFTFSNIFAQNEFIDESYISISGSSINSIGHFEEAWTTASAFYLSYGMIYSSHWSLIFRTGYMNFKENSEYNFTSSDPKFNVIPLQVGGRYYILLGGIRPFLSAMNGINIINAQYNAEVTDEEGRPSILVIDESTWKYNFQVGFGLAVNIIRNLEVEGVFHYNSHIIDASIPYNATGLEFTFGLNWFISRD